MSLQIQELSKSFGERSLFSYVTFSVNPQDCVALVGSNGSGKTTLMKIILGLEHPDKGKVILPKDAKVGYLPQEIFLSSDFELNRGQIPKTLWELTSEAFFELHQIQVQIDELEQAMSKNALEPPLQETYERLLNEFERMGGFNWQAKTIRILKGLGFSEKRFHESLSNFSGGWQMRAFFARLLLRAPDYLLLDEPTNYLDISSIIFLEEYLRNYPGGILVVSHDRQFLDRLASSVVALMPEGSKTHHGNYSEFLEARERWALDAQSAQNRQNKERQRIERFIERFRYKATKSSQVQSRIKMLSKIESIQQVIRLPQLDFSFPQCQESGEVVLRSENISRQYDKTEVIRDLSFLLQRKDRLAIIGENGAGKSTLMRILARQDLAFQGSLNWGYRVFPAYFAQDEEISFEKDETVWNRMMRETPIDIVSKLRGLLGTFLFSQDMIEQPVRLLSGGEKSRLGLARLMLRPCNLLLLDEPTNHLDISGREALLNALLEFPGTMIFVSHDRFFIDCLATKILALEPGKTAFYNGNYSQYLWAKEKYSLVETLSSPSENLAKSENLLQEQRREIKRLSNQKQRWKREINEIEAKITEQENQLRDLEQKLSKPPAGLSREDLTNISLLHQEMGAELNQAMRRWETLHSLLDQEEKLN